MPIKKGSKRTWRAGRPGAGEPTVKKIFVITEAQYAHLCSFGTNVSATLRGILERDMQRATMRPARKKPRR